MRRLSSLLGIFLLVVLAGCSATTPKGADLPLTRVSLLFFYTDA